jgi:hypothetical protein
MTSSTLYAFSAEAISKSEDGGLSWQTVYTALAGMTISSLALDLQSAGRLYVGLLGPRQCVVADFCGPVGGGVLRSDDGGASWQQLQTNKAVYSLRVDPLTGSTVYAGVSLGLFEGMGVYKSVDSGVSWRRLPQNDIFSLAIDPSNPSTLYASTSFDGIVKSVDGGESWSASGLAGNTIASLAVDPSSSSTVYAGTGSGVFRSRDSGASWHPIGLGGSYVSGLAFDPSSPETAYALVQPGRLFRFTTAPICAADPTTVCLNGDRFRVGVEWRTADGRSGSGRALPVTSNTGSFWFFSPSNIELAVKIIDGTTVNGRFWVFVGALTAVEYEITVTDSLTGEIRAYFNPRGRLSSFADTTAFPSVGASGLTEATDAVAPLASTAYLGATEACAAGPENLCLAGSRFRVEVDWRTKDGRSGSGRAVPLTSDTGYFWFFGASNVELIVKVLDARGINGHYWVFYGALSNVAYTITVTDTETGILKTYENSQGNLASVADTEAF